MKAKVTGMTTWQDTPTGGTLRIYPEGRYEDGQGNAVPGRYDFVLDVPTRTWRDERNPAAAAYIVVAGTGDAGPAVEAVFEEIFLYPGNVRVSNIYRRMLIASDLDATQYNYTEPNAPTYTGREPLTMQAARELLVRGATLNNQTSDALAEAARSVGVAQDARQAALAAVANLNGRVQGAATDAADQAAALATARIDTTIAQVVSGTNLDGAVDTVVQLPSGQGNGTEYVVRETGTVWRVQAGAWINTLQGSVPVAALSAPTQGAALRKLADGGAGIRVDCIGDSLTHGQFDQPDGVEPGVKPNGQTPFGYKQAPTPWPAALQEVLGFLQPGRSIEVRNLGWPGDRTTEALTRWAGVDRSQTDVAIIMLGTNDQGNYAGYPDGPNSMATYQRNMATLIERYRSAGAAVILMAPPLIGDTYANARTRGHAEAMRMLAERYGAVYVDAGELLGALPSSNDLYYDGLHLSRPAYALLGWRLGSVFGPYGARPPQVGPGSVFYPRDNVWAGRYTRVNQTAQAVVGADRVRLAVGEVCVVPFDASAPIIPTVRAAAPGAAAQLECIYYGGVTALSPVVGTLPAGGRSVEFSAHQHPVGPGLLILRAVDGPVDIEWIRFQGVEALPVTFGEVPEANTTRSRLAGRGVQQRAGRDWTYIYDPQSAATLLKGKALRMSGALGHDGLQGLMLLATAPSGPYGFAGGASGYWVLRSGRSLVLRRFVDGGAEDLFNVADVFPSGTWTGVLSVRWADEGLVVSVDGTVRLTVDAPQWSQYQPGLLAGLSLDAYAACHAVTVD